MIIILIFFQGIITGQVVGRFTQKYNLLINPSLKTYDYRDIEGTPYLNKDFVDGIIYLKDSTILKLPLRYNIYADVMEFQLNGVNYVIGNHSYVDKITIDTSVFFYYSFIDKGGYFELIESGKCFLVQKSRVIYKPAESPKPIENKVIPARFERNSDIFYIVNNSNGFKIKNMNSVLDALQDQKIKIESFIKQEKIKKTRKTDLVKIVKYYNRL